MTKKINSINKPRKERNFYNPNQKKIDAKKKKRIRLTNYLHRTRKIKQGIVLKDICYTEVTYPFLINLKLINEYLKKK